MSAAVVTHGSRAHVVLMDALRVVSRIGCDFVDMETAHAVTASCEALVHAIAAEMEIGLEHPSARAGIAEFLAEVGVLHAALCRALSVDVGDLALVVRVFDVAQMMARVAALIAEAT